MKGFLSPQWLFLQVFLLPHSFCSLSLSTTASAEQLPPDRWLVSAWTGSCGAITCILVVRSQTQSSKLSTQPPSFSLRWVLARDVVISTKPNSDPLPSSSFNKIFLKPPGPPSASNNSWVGKFPARFLPLTSSVLFSESFIHTVLSPWSRPDGTMVSISVMCTCAPF